METTEAPKLTWTKEWKKEGVALILQEQAQAQRAGDTRKVKRLQKFIAQVEALPEA